VKFDTTKYMEFILNEGSWFWGSVGLFMIPFFLSFNENIMVVYKIPVWVKIHNIPLHFWHIKVLEGI